jgi:hypothetical protein
MNESVQDAISTLGKHPRVSNVRAQVLPQAAGVVVTADIDTNLPSTWKALGRSPYGVFPIETVEIFFPADYPRIAPCPSLRPDFNASLPHINPHTAGERIPPCIYQGSLLDALHNEGFGRLVVQLVSWLEKAGDGSLINPEQGWEPTRRSGGDHIVEFDIEGLEKRRPRLGGLQLFQMAQFWRKDGTYSYANDLRPRSSASFWGRDLRELIDLTGSLPLQYVGPTLLALCWPTSGFDGIAAPDSRYLPDTVSNFDEMVLRADAWGCKAALERFTSVVNDAAKHLPITCVLPLYVGLVVKRPFHLIGMTTDYEVLVYRLQVPIPRGITGSVTKVDPVPVLATVSPALLRRTSAIPNNAPGVRSTFLGCGSLGSKLILHVARAGFPPELLIDHSYFLPHNAARHTLTPGDLLSGGTKAEKLAALVNELNPGKGTMSFSKRVQALPLGGRSGYGIVLDPDAILVNTTGSSPVRHFLAGSEFRSRTVEACLTEMGRIGVMTVEGPARNPSTTDLMALTYEKLRELGRLQAFQQNASNTLQVGVGCNSVTLPMSDARISLIAAGIGQSLLTMQVDALPNYGKVTIGVVDDDGMSVQWRHAEVGATQVVNAERADGWTIRILAQAHDKMSEDVLRYRTVETGGIIVGRVSTTAREIIITDVLPAPDDSVRSAAQFALGTNGREALVDAYEESGGGVLWCLGTWHSHLDDVEPSALDRQTADLLQAQMQRITVLLIHRPTGYSAVVRAPGA